MAAVRVWHVLVRSHNVSCHGVRAGIHASALRVRLPRQQVVAGGSFMNFRNDMALGGNLATQFAATPETQARSLCARAHKRCS